MLADLYADFQTVLRTAPHGDAVLSGLLLPVNSIETPVADILSAPCDESIDIKLARNDYLPEQSDSNSPNGPQLFLHDLKLCFGRIIGQYPQDSAEYAEITKLFKFSIDLLVRECDRIRVKLHNGLGDIDDEYLARLSQGFDTISTEVEGWNTETFWITAANGPLFMSAPSKAPVDPRDTAVAGSVHTVKLLPYTARAPESTLGFTSPLNPRIPQPELPPTDMLSGFRHPNGSAVVPPLWITGQGGYSSFAPSSDSNNAVVSTEDSAQVWLAKAPKENETKLKPDVVMHESEGENDETMALESFQTENGRDLDPSDLELLLRWTPQSFVDDDELEAAANGTERELATSLLLEVQHMRSERLSGPSPDDVSDKERLAALKVGNLLARLVEDADYEDIKLPLDTRVPVLMRNYAGSLPNATDPAVHAPNSAQLANSQRLQTLANMRRRPVIGRR